MICLVAPVEMAIVDRVEDESARVEFASMELVDFHIGRLPVGVKEGEVLCYCASNRWVRPTGLRRCPESMDQVFTEERRTLWSW